MGAVVAALPAAASIVSSVGSLLGGSNKNALRDQQEAASYQRALAGSIADAQSIYHNQTPGSGQTHERIVDDTQYWQQLQAQGWTVANGTVVPPSRTTVPGQPSTLGAVPQGNYTIAGSAAPPNPLLTAAPTTSFIATPTGELLLFGGGLLAVLLVVVLVRR